jgi:hypothetical protein
LAVWASRLLAGGDEVAAAHGADHFLPQQMDAIAGHDAEFEGGLS